MKFLVSLAFMIPIDEVVVPEWTSGANYDIQATTTADDFGTELVPGRDWPKISMLRLQSLLEDRFKLKMHYEDRMATVYELTIAKGGIKFEEGPPITKSCCWVTKPTRFGVKDQTIGYMSLMLRNFYLHAEVLDKTNLHGTYTFTIDFESPGFAALTPPEPPLPSIFTAFQAIGLKLEPKKALTRFLVVDHIERPTEN